MTKKKGHHILCVDDESQVLDGLSLQLGRKYYVTTVSSAAEALEWMKQGEPFAVVLSDMRMPGMDGATFLSLVRQAHPDTVRMLLTGYTDLEAAIAAVNDGQIFRFLSKPCTPEQLGIAFDAAIKQYELIQSERVLLEQTLRGSIEALAEVLALTHPVVFGRATRIKQYVTELGALLKVPNAWEIEVAAMLSQLGCIGLPEETARKLYFGEELTDAEKSMVQRSTAVTEQLVRHIPRLEGVREILTEVERPQKSSLSAGTQMRATLLRIALDFDALEARGNSPEVALDTMRGRKGTYDTDALETFARLQGAARKVQDITEIPIKSVQLGMILAEDVKLQNGVLLVSRGFEVTPGFLERVRNLRGGAVKDPIRVIIPAKSPAQ